MIGKRRGGQNRCTWWSRCTSTNKGRPLHRHLRRKRGRKRIPRFPRKIRWRHCAMRALLEASGNLLTAFLLLPRARCLAGRASNVPLSPSLFVSFIILILMFIYCANCYVVFSLGSLGKFRKSMSDLLLEQDPNVDTSTIVRFHHKKE